MGRDEMNSNIEILNEKQVNELSNFLRKIECSSEKVSNSLDIEKLTKIISEKYEKAISQGQVKAIIHRILGLTLTSTERSQLYELRQKIQKYERFLTYFREWGYKYDYELKIIILGVIDEQSEMLSKILNKPRNSPDRNIIGVDFYTKLIDNFDKTLTNLQIWDVSNYTRFESIRKQYYKGAAAAILVFDKSNQESFDLTKRYYIELKEVTGLKFSRRSRKVKEISMPLALIGVGQTKNIPIEEIYSTAKDFGAQYFDFEDIYDENLQETFTYLAYQVILRFQE